MGGESARFVNDASSRWEPAAPDVLVLGTLAPMSKHRHARRSTRTADGTAPRGGYRDGMGISTLLNRSLSLLVAAGWVALSQRLGDTEGAPMRFGLCLLPILALIWFGDALGSFTGYVGRGGTIDQESPGCLVCALGWFLLVGIPVVLWLARV
jgi:hypothetical protein